MASPMPFQPQGGWSLNGQAMPHPNANPSEETGVQVRAAGLKILYKFNKDDKFDCLARPSQTFNVQTIPIDETTTIGVVDLRLCIQAVIDCSPELPGHQLDYTIYAHDYSEPDTPLVGQGMLSAALHSMQHDMGGQPPKMVTGLITRNKLGALMGNANKEILEIKMKFTETPRVQAPPPPQQMQPQPHQHMQQQQHHHHHQQHPHQPQAQSQQHYQPQNQHQFQQPQESQHHEEMFQPSVRPMDGSMTPTSTAEWSSFMQSNPQIGQAPAMSRGASPALSQAPSNMGHGRRDSFTQNIQPQPMPPAEISRVAPVPVEQAPDANPTGASSRPSSRASNRAPRKRGPTGRPRGRPRKTAPEGNTSGYEDGTEGEDGPMKKRVKTTKVDKVNTNPFGAEPESLRVAASTSGSLRNFRPLAMRGEAVAGNHLQEVPRAPTPVPIAPFPGKSGGKTAARQSALSRETSAVSRSPQAQKTRALSPSQEDGRSPESMADTPAFSEGSPADIGSSPPVPRATSFMQSSPPPSSPMLPPMPQQPASQDDILENDDLGDLFGEEPPRPEPERKPTSNGPGRKPRNPSNIPVQVFRMADGPDGNQDMVHVRSYNTPEPTSGAAGPGSDHASKPTRRSWAPVAPAPPRPMPNSHHPYYHHPPVPTPPQTTDAPEKPTSPPIDEAQPAAPSQNQSLDQTSQQTPAEQMAQPFLAGVPEPPQQSIESTNEQSEAQATTDNPVPTVTDKGNAAESLQAESKEKGKSTKQKNPAPAKPRKLARSHSAGALALPLAPASEPAGPSTLSQSFTAEHEHQHPAPPTAPAGLRRAASSGPTGVPASDPVGPASAVTQSTTLMLPMCPPSEPIPAAPSSPQGDRSNKNEVKKNAIKQRLEAAILRGEMPPYCSNCGAIETPTWRKIYSQDHEGSAPQYKPHELSTKPGMITIVQQLPQASEDAPQKYRITKKTLGSEEVKDEWQEHLLCNPCGIWLAKCLTHRPADRWDGDAARLGQNRKRRSGDSSNPRPKRVRTKSNPQAANLTSEINIPTDAPGPIEPSSISGPGMSMPAVEDEPATQNKDAAVEQDEFRPRSTHSNGSGTAKSPVNLDFDEAMGSTKRLLFPSPRKDDSPKTLGELSVNIVHTSPGYRPRKEPSTAKENLAIPQNGKPTEGDDLEDLFRSPVPPRPSTPTSNTKAAQPTTPFKTPTRATPSHRPITRSVSRSMRSKESLGSPANIQGTPSRTPSKTPRDFGLALAGSSIRRSPRNHNTINFDDCIFDTPVSRAVNQMLSETNFGLDDEMDLVNLNTADSDAHWANFSSYFSTDAPMPSSPPKEQLGYQEESTNNVWEHLNIEHLVGANTGTEQ